MKRWGLVGLVLILVVVAASVIAFRTALQMLKGKVVAAIGPGSEIAELNLRWSSVELLGLSIEGPKGWPAPLTLHAERVEIVPSLRTLFTDQIHVASITVGKLYLSVLRTEDRLLLVPSLLGAPARSKITHPGKPGASSQTVTISKIVVEDGAIELFDATVAQPPLKIRLDQIEAAVHNLVAPSFQERVRFDLKAVVKGAKRDGRATVSGWIAAIGKDSDSRIVLESVDLVTLQPYLARTGEARVSQGALDLDLKSEVRNYKLDGQGRMVIKEMEFEPSQSYLDTFMGVPRQAVIRFLKNHQDEIDVSFAIQGDISSPTFSLNESMATRIAAAVAGQLGLSIKGVAETVDALGRKGLEGVGEVTEGIGSVLRRLFGGDQK